MTRKILPAVTVSLAGFLMAVLPASPAGRMPIHANGYITDTWCGVNRDTKAPSEMCTRMCVRDKGAKFAFYDKITKRVYIIEQQDKAAAFAGQTVDVEGFIERELTTTRTMRGVQQVETISLKSIKFVAPASGQK